MQGRLQPVGTDAIAHSLRELLEPIGGRQPANKGADASSVITKLRTNSFDDRPTITLYDSTSTTPTQGLCCHSLLAFCQRSLADLQHATPAPGTTQQDGLT